MAGIQKQNDTTMSQPLHRTSQDWNLWKRSDDNRSPQPQHYHKAQYLSSSNSANLCYSSLDLGHEYRSLYAKRSSSSSTPLSSMSSGSLYRSYRKSFAFDFNENDVNQYFVQEQLSSEGRHGGSPSVSRLSSRMSSRNLSPGVEEMSFSTTDTNGSDNSKYSNYNQREGYEGDRPQLVKERVKIQKQPNLETARRIPIKIQKSEDEEDNFIEAEGPTFSDVDSKSNIFETYSGSSTISKNFETSFSSCTKLDQSENAFNLATTQAKSPRSLIDEIEKIKNFISQSRKVPIVLETTKTSKDENENNDFGLSDKNDGVFWADIVHIESEASVCDINDNFVQKSSNEPSLQTSKQICKQTANRKSWLLDNLQTPSSQRILVTDL